MAMNQPIKKIISILLLVIFLSGSGAGQLIHSIFHKHPVCDSTQTSVSVSSPRIFCNALQLMLPEFSESTICSIPGTLTVLNNFFAELQPSITHCNFFNSSGRAPPVLA